MQLLRGTAPPERRDEWVMILSLPRLQPRSDPAAAEGHEEEARRLTEREEGPERRFHFVGVELARVADDAPSELHGLLGQRAAARSLGVGAPGTASAGAPGGDVMAAAAFGPQGEGAIEGVYHEYEVVALSAHPSRGGSSRYGRLACGP